MIQAAFLLPALAAGAGSTPTSPRARVACVLSPPARVACASVPTLVCAGSTARQTISVERKWLVVWSVLLLDYGSYQEVADARFINHPQRVGREEVSQCLCVFLCMCVSACLSVCVSFRLRVCRTAYLRVCVSADPDVSASVCVSESVCASAFLSDSVCFLSPSLCVSVFVSSCLRVCRCLLCLFVCQ